LAVALKQDFRSNDDLMKRFPLGRIRYVECEVGRLTGTRPCD
jgi:hypothetical protein